VDGSSLEVPAVPEPTTTADEPAADFPEPPEPIVSGTVEAVPAVNIHLHVQCTADEIEDLAPRLKALIRELSDQGGKGARGTPPF
jgi:hypothetical protein